ncbi:sugar ABC transporter ATP-binding protein [Paracoccus mangrovi]|uniref:Sugar ABC transporter ATP-binding protein n=1 Tax=Paracoccus mangrovi TaxID=1715645 RepID=A0ABV7R6B3_9RHOB
MLELRNIQKSFNGFPALKDVSVTVAPGQVVGLVGENGAGKSTLMKILNGIHRPDGGEYRLDGKPVALNGPREAMGHGIGMVYQEQSLIPSLTVAENIFLGNEDRFVRLGRVDWKAMGEAARAIMAEVELHIDPFTLTSDISFMHRQMVELAKVLTLKDMAPGNIYMLLDEPTSVLEQEEIDILFGVIRKIKERAGIVFVSHRLDEVIEISDIIYVLKDGQVVKTLARGEATPPLIHELMVGRSAAQSYYRETDRKPPSDKVLLEIAGLGKADAFQGIDLTLHEGEVIALVGTEGAGTEPLIRSVFGLEKVDGGQIMFQGKPITNGICAQAVAAGIGYVPRERKIEGIIEPMTIEENVVLPNLRRMTRAGLLDFPKIRAATKHLFGPLRIKAESRLATAKSLSGGNQQKVVLAKWYNTGARLFLLDHPTRGLDVGAKEDVYDLIREICARGAGVLLIADTLEEAIGLSHRIIVYRDGRETARFDNADPARPVTPLDLIGHMV